MQPDAPIVEPEAWAVHVLTASQQLSKTAAAGLPLLRSTSTQDPPPSIDVLKFIAAAGSAEAAASMYWRRAHHSH
jgi:hypothetical protein